MLTQIKNLFKPKKQSDAKMNADEEEWERTANAAVRLVEEEKQRKSQMPQYPGLERFDIIEKIGDGAFSNVYKARDTKTNKMVAIKVVRKRELDASDMGRTHLHPNMKKKTKVTERANIMKEVQIMRNIKHNNIVQLIQFTESDDYYFLVLELCQGGELFHQIVKLTYLSEPLARHVIVQVAQGIHHLHEECGVVHRDIKPENILFEPIPFIPSENPENAFDEEDKEDEGKFTEGVGGGGIGVVKLADFGLSKVIWDNSTLTPCGTVGYTAPEIVRDQKYSKSVDMWAIGCVLYTILCGFPPFYDESIRALTEKVARGQYTFLSPWWDPISDSAKDLISHLLCIDPNQRYTINEFFEHPWVTGKPFPPPQPQQNASNIPVMKKQGGDARMQAIQNAAAKAQRQQQQQQQQPAYASALPTPGAHDLDTPTTTRRKDLFSPDVASIKEILDITYAVQRMGEEKTKHGQHRQHHQLHAVDSYDQSCSSDEDESSEGSQDASPPKSAAGYSNKDRMAMAEQLAHDGRGVAGNYGGKHTISHPQQQQQSNMSTPLSRRRKHGFQLDMGNATILKNRKVQPPTMNGAPVSVQN